MRNKADKVRLREWLCELKLRIVKMKNLPKSVMDPYRIEVERVEMSSPKR